MATIDKELAKEIKKESMGDGSRAAKFAFVRKAEAAARLMSSPEVMHEFPKAIKEHGRVAVAVCLAATIDKRKNRLNASTVEWASEILKCWKNQPGSLDRAIIHDGLHPCRIEEYAGSFIKLTQE